MRSSDTTARRGGRHTARPIDLDAGRRTFFQASGLALASATLLGAGGLSQGASAQSAPPTDVQILNFALNLEYLEGEFYSRAVSNLGLEPQDTTGVGGDPGPVSGGRKVSFTSPLVVDLANEIANDEIAHVRFIRRNLGSSAAARPAIDIDGAFTTAAQAAGIVGPGETFDPYASDVNFLLGAYMFEVGVTPITARLRSSAARRSCGRPPGFWRSNPTITAPFARCCSACRPPTPPCRSFRTRA